MSSFYQNRSYSPYRSFYTLLRKEIRRYLIMAPQTLLAPLITVCLYLLVFGVSLGRRISLGTEVSYLDFVIPGLILMGAINNTFANISSSLFLSKYLGNIADILVAPISAMQFLMAYTLAAMTRGLLVSALIYGVSLFFSQTPWQSPFLGFFILFLASFIFAQIGVIASLTSASFDTLSMYTNFLLLPLIYLGGLFYPVSNLPAPWSTLSKFNPLYYLIEGFRSAMLGATELSIGSAIFGATIVALILFSITYWLIKTGYKLRN